MASELQWTRSNDNALVASVSEQGPSRVWVDVSLGGEGGSAELVRAGMLLRVECDPETPDTLSVEALRADSGDAVASLTYRAIPDYEKWTPNEDERRKYAEEFADVPRWPDRTVRLAIDATPRTVVTWIDGRYVAEVTGPAGDDEAVELRFGGGAELANSGVVSLPDADRFVYVDPAAWGASAAESRSGSVQFLASESLDLSRTSYRDVQPYVYGSALDPDPTRAMMRVPKRQYDRAHVLCRATGEEGTAADASLRFITPGRGRNTTNQFTAPTGSAPEHVVVDLDPGAFHDFLTTDEFDALNIDLTRRIALDVNRFPRPAGPPSGVLVSAITFETAPVALEVTSDVTGHIFEEPESPSFRVNLSSQRDQMQTVQIEWRVVAPDGTVETGSRQAVLDAWQSREERIDVPTSLYGTFDFSVVISQPDGSRPITRNTTFAVLPPDMREDELESPFGVWCFFDGHFGVPAETAAPLMRKAGIRWTLANFLPMKEPDRLATMLSVLEQNKVRISCANVACIHLSCNEGADVDAMIERMRNMPSAPHWLVFWETSLSRPHDTGFIRELVGDDPRPLTEDESRALDNCVRVATEYATRVREEFPDVKLIYGNGYVSFIGALMARGFPADLIDGFGLDFDMYLAMPEWQPGPLHAPFNGLHNLTRLQEIYGYADKPRYLTEAIYAPQAEGWHSERDQADCYVRAHLLSLASGVVHFGMTTEVWDPDGWYHYGHYGPVGLCRTAPELNPRESFCAYATMTRELDGMRFDAMLWTPSPSVFALRFAGEAGAVHTFWTVRGERELTFTAEGTPAAVDMNGNPVAVAVDNGECTLTVRTSPVYLRGVELVSGIEAGTPRHAGSGDGLTALATFSVPEEWTVVSEPDALLDDLVNMNHGTLRAPYRHGGVEVGVRDGGLHVHAEPRDDIHGLYVRYERLACVEPKDIPANARTIGARISGNSSWGRLVMVLTDANGIQWRSLFSHDYIDFDGECLLETRLPCTETDEDIDPRDYSSWLCEDENAEPAPPFRLTGVVTEARSHVIRGSEMTPVSDPVWIAHEIYTRRGA